MTQDTSQSRDPDPRAEPEPLALRTHLRPVTRFNRKVLMGIAGVVCVVVLAATLVALEPIRFRQGPEQELINTERKAKAEGLDTLPRSYAEVKPPELGPPLQGDVGPPVVRLERELGVSHGDALRPDAEADAERAERLRVARLAQQAREATVFFQTSSRRQDVAAQLPAASGALPVPSAQTGGASQSGSLDREGASTAQARKIAFLDSRTDTNVVNRYALQAASADQVLAGTVIAASLLTGINSDLPGFVIAQVTENVFDSVTGGRLLIPQGTKLIGKYDSVISFGQRRALVVWNRLILPDGSSIVVDNLPATDAAGYAGLEDEVDFHTWQLMKGAALSTLLGVAAEIGAQGGGGATLSAARESVQQNAARIGQAFTERHLDVQPTITVRAGWPLRVIVHQDLLLREYKR